MLSPMIGRGGGFVQTVTLSSPLDTNGNYTVPKGANRLSSAIVVGGGGSGSCEPVGGKLGGHGGGGEVAVFSGYNLSCTPGATWTYRVGSGGLSTLVTSEQDGHYSWLRATFIGTPATFDTERDFTEGGAG